jgi:hypothetical protein
MSTAAFIIASIVALIVRSVGAWVTWFALNNGRPCVRRNYHQLCAATCTNAPNSFVSTPILRHGDHNTIAYPCQYGVS